MKKRFLSLFLLLIILLTLTACIRFDTTIKVNANGTSDVRMLIAVSDALSSMIDTESLGLGLSEEEIAEIKAKGFSYENYSDDEAGYTGYIISRKGISLQPENNEKTETGIESIIDGTCFVVDGKHVVLDLIPFSESDYQEASSYDYLVKNYGGYMKFNLELPVKPTNHNATSVSEDGKTLTWDLIKLGINDKIHAEFDMPSFSFLAWLLPVIGVVLVAIVVTVLFYKKNKIVVMPKSESSEKEDSVSDCESEE